MSRLGTSRYGRVWSGLDKLVKGRMDAQYMRSVCFEKRPQENRRTLRKEIEERSRRVGECGSV